MSDRDGSVDVASAIASADESPRTTSASLADYERTKLILADVVRQAMDSIADTDPRREQCLTLFQRLAEDRFNLVVAGRFNRGKSTLMNAILGMDRLPCGTLPLTSVITDVVYGTTEDVRIEMRHGGLPIRIPMDRLIDYLTERGNPGNSMGIRCARVELPAEILRRGFHLIDTPGLGSSIRENSATTLEFLPEADALILVTAFDGPLSEEELRALDSIAGTGLPAFVVLNKQDLLAPGARADATRFVERELRRHFGSTPLPIFSISARDGLTAKLEGNADVLPATGLPTLEDGLTRFLIEQKSRRFLTRMIDRAQELIDGAVAQNARAPLRRTLDVLRRRPLSLDAAQSGATDASIRVRSPPLRFRHCEVCTRINTAFFDFLRQYQHSLIADPETLGAFVADGGFCPRHLWMYASMAAPRDLCVTLAPLIDRRIEEWRLRAASRNGDAEIKPVRPRIRRCPLCALQIEIERDVVGQFSRLDTAEEPRPASASPVFCGPHMARLAPRWGATDRARALYADQVGAAVRLTEDMRRYAMKRDALREALTSEEERNAAKDAVELLAGRRSINA